MNNIDTFLLLGGALSFSAAILHVGIILKGSDWYRKFGAGERFAKMAEQGSLYPAFVTSFIAIILFLFSLFAFSGAGLIEPLPSMGEVLILITLVYLVRGIVGFILLFYNNRPFITALGSKFIIWSSVICLGFGLVHIIGLFHQWSYIMGSNT